MKKFRVPDEATRRAAIGLEYVKDSKDLPLFEPYSDCFDPIQKPGFNDWLTSFPDDGGQTFQKWLNDSVPKKSIAGRKILLMPIGDFKSNRVAPNLKVLEEYCSVFFQTPSELLPEMTLDLDSSSKFAKGTFNNTNYNLTCRMREGELQLLTTDILNFLKQTISEHDESFCILGITMIDLYPRDSWNFVFGSASRAKYVGIFSFARYEGTPELTLRRSLKVMTHEIVHIFGIKHCTYFQCLINGSNHLEESDARPMHLCPVDLHKLKHFIGFSVIERYKALRKFYEKHKMQDEFDWTTAILQKLTNNQIQ